MPHKSLQDSSLGIATLCSADSVVSNPSSCACYEQVLPSLVRTAQGIAGDNFSGYLAYGKEPGMGHSFE